MKKIYIFTFCAVLLISGVLYYVRTDNPTRSFSNGQSSGSQTGIASFDENDLPQVVGIAHYFFVGRALNKGETVRVSGFDMTPYDVEIIYNVKGDLNGVLRMYGTGLEIGSTYLMGARWNWNNWGNVTVFDIGRKLISSDRNASNESLKLISENDRDVLDAKAAYKNEVLTLSDRKYNTAYNSYESLKSGHLFTPPPFAGAIESVSPSAEPIKASPEPTLEPSASAVITKTPAEESPMPTPELSITPEPARE